MKKLIKIVPVILCLSALTVTALGSSSLISVNGKDLSISDINSTKSNYSFASQIGAEVDVPSTEDALEMNIKRQLLEQEFEEQGIDLIDQEQRYAKDYLADQIEILDEMIDRGGSQRENAEEVLALMEQYTKQSGISMEEYAQLVEEEITFELKYSKLVAQAYDGDTARLEESLEQRCSEIMSAQGVNN